MPRDATETRERLVRAAERRFARDGIGGTRLRDIVTDAGQRNDAAIAYHFGSRDGLLFEVAQRRIAQMEARRQEPTDQSDVPALVRLVVAPTAALLEEPGGRDFLRIMEQAAGWAGLEGARPAPVLQGTVLSRQLEALQSRLEAAIGRRRARVRTAEMALFLTASLAERARRVDSLSPGRRMTMSHDRYVDELVTMLTGALTARP